MADLAGVVTSLNNLVQVLSKFVQNTGLGIVVPISGGGTGATTAAGARGNLGLGAVAVQNVVPVSEGGTGNTSAGATAANAIGALAIVNNLSDVGNAGTSRTNLGLGTAATRAASNGALANVASVSGSTVANHLATFADTAGSVQDAGLAGPYATASLGQLPGTATNDNAAAGDIGEYISSNIPAGSAVTLASTATAYTIASIALTAGDWDIDGIIHFTPPGTAGTNWFVYLSLVSAALPTVLSDILSGTNGPGSEFNDASGLLNAEQITTGPGRLSVASPTTVYLVAQMMYTGAAPTAYGFIRARRMR